MNRANKITDALNAAASLSEETPPTLWVVLQFGRGVRPVVTCSENLSLAVTQFYQLAYLTAALIPDAKYALVGNDDDAALMGLSLYMDDSVALILQPAGQIVRHPLDPTASNLPADTFEASAPLILQALERRSTVGAAERERLLHSSVALSFSRDLDEVLLEDALQEDAVAGRDTKPVVQSVWKAIRDAKVMVSLSAPIL